MNFIPPKTDYNLKYTKEIRNFLKELKYKIDSSKKFSLGIGLGLIMGIFGNMYVTLIYDYVIYNFSKESKLFLILIVSLIIALVFIITIFDYKSLSNKERIINNNIDLLSNEIDKIEK